MGARRHLGGDLVEMPLHGLSIAARQDESGTDAAIGADGAEDIGRLGALVVWRYGTRSSLGPAPCDLVLLADPGFILPPQFYLGSGRQGGTDRCQLGGEVFFKSLKDFDVLGVVARTGRQLAEPHAFNSRLIVDSSGEMANCSETHCTRSLSRQRTTPSTAGIGPRSTVAAR